MIPKANLGKFTEFLTSDAMLVSGAAIVLTPLLRASVDRIIEQVPFLKDHSTIALLIAAFVVFMLVSKLSGKLRQIGIGFATGLAIAGILPLIPEVN